MDDTLAILREEIEDALDDVLSSLSSNERKWRALRSLERKLAACVNKSIAEQENLFISLQYTFQCNVASRLLPWVHSCSVRLEELALQGLSDDDRRQEVADLLTQLSTALSVMQGITMKHDATKVFMGRRFPLQVFVNLLLTSRHVSSLPLKKSSVVNARTPLTSMVLDTLLCILVDSPGSMRAFEKCNGVQAVVKILKRAGTPREVRMKCLEFLYFYLLDEGQQTSAHDTPPVAPPALLPAEPTPPQTAPATPIRSASKKPFFPSGPRRPMSRYGSSTYAFSSGSCDSTTSSTTSAPSSRSTSASSTQSISSTSSIASTTTAPPTWPSTPASPKKGSTSSLKRQPTTPSTPPVFSKPQNPMMMLRKDVDYTPESPQKVSTPSHGNLQGTLLSGHARTRSILQGSGDERATRDGRLKSTDEKRRYLGTMLGNVDALVESVSKAGIWGLG